MSLIDELPGPMSISRTVSESDVYLFAGITGDLSPVHTDAEYMRGSPIGERIAHGAYLLGLMSAASASWCRMAGFDSLSYGYDRLRFIRPVRFGDTITVTFTPDSERPAKRQLIARLEARNQRGEVVGAALHILQRMDVQRSLKPEAT